MFADLLHSARLPCLLGGFRVADGDNLLSDDRQHFDVDSIELVEAAPAAGLRQPGEEATHHLHANAARFSLPPCLHSDNDLPQCYLEIKSFRAVKDHAHESERLGQVLRGFGLPCSGRTRRRSP